MGRFQLLGKSRYFMLGGASQREPLELDQRVDGQDARHMQENGMLVRLPERILLKVLRMLDLNTLLALCPLHSRLYDVISNNLLFENVKLHSKVSLLQFNSLIHSEFRTSNTLHKRREGRASGKGQLDFKSTNARFLVKSVQFIDPQCQDSLLKYSKFYNKQDSSNVIAGSYNLGSSKSGSSKYTYYTYIELVLDIIDYLPNVTHVILSDVSVNFKIPLWYSVFNDGSRDFFKKIIKGQQSMTLNDLRTFEISQQFVDEYQRKFYSLQRIKTLEIRGAKQQTASAQTLLLRPNLLCCFGIITELRLENVTIDTASLDTPMEFLPLVLRRDSRGIHTVFAPFSRLVLTGCKITPGNGILRLFQSYFKQVTTVSLLEITSKYDLLLCNCFPALTELTLDCNSDCFTTAKQLVSDDYYYRQTDPTLENTMDDDCNSVTETLLDNPLEHVLQSPPPTTPVVLSLNLKYLSRTMTDTNRRTVRKPSQLTRGQGEYFNMSKVPPFHYFYHDYKSLWDRLPHRNVNINVINIPFTNVSPLPPRLYAERLVLGADSLDQETLIAYRAAANRAGVAANYYWIDDVKRCLKNELASIDTDENVDTLVDKIEEDSLNNYQNFKNFKDIPNINLYCFFKSLSRFKSVKIQMLRKKADCTQRTRYEWELLFQPVLNVNVPIEVRDRDGVLMYSYGRPK
ncbi:putative SCF ubiquitin ligase complex subunit SKP2 KNAG_0K02470 [Huiozyma naganishii CBS 8797]|uniref:F-box domain-containing protein n=1 Tax=Huiozyma naganishii (strain ATCC MYA-139 / BCRC 22969 / CBS 8797 / KCTC 17520 / NBRC 10181 / NCYC 3082 / Yp74L-3) TaxID=1071383 RepID=J7RCL6_HUIN7|nr:hypothetical protein KNAG_0K02470 [Kazachstania naganishii CBS 8797]CCK72610.1 hypothetical protein KNAG_0K02470 [Kazachstania naganishii CBS 8797]